MRSLVLTGLVVVALGANVRAADEFKLEEGFKLIFDGKDLSGWKVRKYSQKSAESVAVDGKADAADKRFVVTDKKIVVDAKVKGDMVLETAKSFDKDVHIKFDYLPAE